MPPLVSYRTNRQLSGWLLPPLVTSSTGDTRLRGALNNNEKNRRGSVRTFDQAPGDPAEMHASRPLALKIQSENNGSASWWPRSYAAPAELANVRRTCRAQSLYCANRPRAAAHLLGSGASGGATRRNKAIAPYDPHFVSFNFTNNLIWRVASTTPARRRCAASTTSPKRISTAPSRSI
jgi:hypothetical protein